jgi:hypothetical protein
MAGRIAFPFAQRPVGRDSRAKVPVRPLAPRIAPAAVRVPDPRYIQVEIPFPSGRPEIFVHEGARQSLERRLTQAALKPVVLSITDNRRSMIAFSSKGGVLRARLHHMFLDAPASVQEALIRYVARGNREASHIVGRYIDHNGHRIRACRPFLRPLLTQGAVHDLLAIFEALNDKYFGGTVDALITWGKAGHRRAAQRSTVKLGSYSAVERLIRVHPVLDRPWVPRYFVSYIVYHEMLHHVIPADIDSGRRILHPKAFLDRESLFRDYERSLAWEKAHIRRMLRS